MLKSEFDEASTWATAYSVAAAVLALGLSAKQEWGHTDEEFSSIVDSRAALIADKATKRLKGKLKTK